jgi:peptide/nickel transport system substrate-binding protein
MQTPFRRAAALTAALVALVAAGCGGGSSATKATGDLVDCNSEPNTCNTASVEAGGEATYAIKSPIANWNLRHPAGTTEAGWSVLSGVLPFAFLLQPDGVTNALSKDLLVSAEQTNSSPQTIVYRIQPKAQWSDGTPITADDFVYNWHVSDGKHCPTCQATTAGYDQIRSVTGSDGGKTATVVFATPFTDWKMLFSPLLPAHVAKQYGNIATPEGLAKGFNEGFVQNPPKWSAGPYQIASVKPNVAIVERPNPAWWGSKPNLRQIDFRIVTDSAQLPTALSTGELDIVAQQAEPDLVQQIRAVDGVSTNVGSGSTLAQLLVNTGNPALAEPMRKAILTAVDRKQLMERVLGPAINRDTKAVDSFVLMPNDPGYEDALADSGLGSGAAENAKSQLEQAGYTVRGERLIDPSGKAVPPLRYAYPPDQRTGRLIGTLLTTWLKPLGLRVEPLVGQDFAAILGEGKFDLMFISRGTPGFPYFGAKVFWTSTGIANFGRLASKEVDRLIDAAAAQSDRDRATELLRGADAALVAAAPALPLYAVPTFAAIRSRYANVRPTSTSFLTYNMEDWGLREEAGG